jgi:hypothetical protein
MAGTRAYANPGWRKAEGRPYREDWNQSGQSVASAEPAKPGITRYLTALINQNGEKNKTDIPVLFAGAGRGDANAANRMIAGHPSGKAHRRID